MTGCRKWITPKLNSLLATATTAGSAPLVVAQQLRKGSCGSPRGAKRLVTDALKTTRTLSSAKPLVRADSAFYGRGLVLAAVRAGADVSVTVRLDPKVKAAIAGITEEAWEPIEYTDAVYDEQAGRWISRAEVAEMQASSVAIRDIGLWRRSLRGGVMSVSGYEERWCDVRHADPTGRHVRRGVGPRTGGVP